MMCEKCWSDAYSPIGIPSQPAEYSRLLRERDESHYGCSPREQAGAYWSDILERDSRVEGPQATAFGVSLAMQDWNIPEPDKDIINDFLDRVEQ